VTVTSIYVLATRTTFLRSMMPSHGVAHPLKILLARSLWTGVLETLLGTANFAATMKGRVVVTLTAIGSALGTKAAFAGNGGYLGQDSAGFPMWTLVALALGSLALVGGGLLTRRSGK